MGCQIFKMTSYLQIIPFCYVKSIVFFEKREKLMNLISPGAVWGLLLRHGNAATHILKPSHTRVRLSHDFKIGRSDPIFSPIGSV